MGCPSNSIDALWWHSLLPSQVSHHCYAKMPWLRPILQTMYGSTIKIWQIYIYTVYPKKYAHCFVVLCFVVVMQSFIMNSHEVFIHIHLGCFAGTGAIVRLPQCQWSKPDGHGKISQCITTTKHSKAKTVCIFLGIYCIRVRHEKWRPHLVIIFAYAMQMCPLIGWLE